MLFPTPWVSQVLVGLCRGKESIMLLEVLWGGYTLTLLGELEATYNNSSYCVLCSL